MGSHCAVYGYATGEHPWRRAWTLQSKQVDVLSWQAYRRMYRKWTKSWNTMPTFSTSSYIYSLPPTLQNTCWSWTNFAQLTKRITMEKCKSQQKRTFDTLWEQSTARTRLPHPTDKWMINLSSRLLLVVGVLVKGLKFATMPKWIPFHEIVAVVEWGLKKPGSTLAQQARTMIVGLLIKSRPLPSNLQSVKHKALRNLKADETIVGNGRTPEQIT